ncbi:MAG: TetR/AcrR family transcriptional regulator [Planctomycetota bacterium]
MARLRAPERRLQILETAVELFSRFGYRGTTTAELAKAAGVTEPILYRHFENKLDLFVTLVDAVGEEVITGWEEALSDITNPRERLQTLLASNPASHRRGKGMYRVIIHAMSEVESAPELSKPLRRHLNRLHGFIRDEITSLQDAGAIRKDASPDMLARFLMDVAIGFGMTSPLGIRGQSLTSAKNSMQELLNDILTKKK